MGIEKLIKEIEAEFPPKDFLWTLGRNHTGQRYFANIYPRELREVGRGPDNGFFDARSAHRALRGAFTNARRQGVGRHCFGIRP